MLKRFCAALGLLTVIPLPGACHHTGHEIARSLPFFPWVGLLIGLSGAGLALALDGFLPPLVLAVFLVGWLAAVHGGLHLDGLADTADGFLSHRGREQVMEIMRDSCVGAFGSLAMGGVLALKAAALASLTGQELAGAVLLAPLAGRCAMVFLLDVLPPARADGLGRLFPGGPGLRWKPGAGSILTLAILLGAGWGIAGPSGIAAGIAVLVTTALFGYWCWKRIGGRTGDTAGAAGELVEMVVLVAFSL